MKFIVEMVLRGIVYVAGGWKYHTGETEWPWGMNAQKRGKFNRSVCMAMHLYTNTKITCFTWRPTFGNKWGREISVRVIWSQNNVQMEVCDSKCVKHSQKNYGNIFSSIWRRTKRISERTLYFTTSSWKCYIHEAEDGRLKKDFYCYLQVKNQVWWLYRRK